LGQDSEEGICTPFPMAEVKVKAEATKLSAFGCEEERRASLRCVESHQGSERHLCVPMFEAYKACKREALEQVKLERIRARS